MANITADVHLPHFGEPYKIKLPINAAATVYQGALVFNKAAGGFHAGTPTAGERCVGICAAKAVLAAAGELFDVYVSGAFQVTSTIVSADTGEGLVMKAAVLTNNLADATPVAGAASAANDIYIGRVVSFLDGKGIVLLNPGAIYNATSFWTL